MKFAATSVSVVLMACAALFAADDKLVSNFTFAVGKGPATGELWVVSRGDAGSGLTLLTLELGATGVHATGMQQEILEKEETPVQDGVFSDVTAEHRRTAVASAGDFGWVLPRFETDSSGNYLSPSGFFSARAVNAVDSRELGDPQLSSVDTAYSNAMTHAVSAFAFDSSAKTLWIARGAYGLVRNNFSKGINSSVRSFYAVNKDKLTLDTLSYNYSVKKSVNPAVYGLARHPASGSLWLGTDGGLFEMKSSGMALSKTGVPALDTGRVTGVWIGGKPVQIIVETSVRPGSSTQSHLWRSWNGGAFNEVVFRDTAGKTQKEIYDKADYSVSDVAFLGNRAFLSVQTIEGSLSGLLKLDSVGAVPWENENQWLYGLDAGVVDRNVTVTSVCTFPLASGVTGIAVSTYGAGVSVSADSGKTWSYILNQASVGGNLGSIRMVPSVIEAGGSALVAYKVSKDSKITIEVFSYDMRKIRTIVKSAPRSASSTRSSVATEDIWDGYDEYGRAAAMGVYYVRVKDNHGHIGWGKVMTLGGGK